MLSYAIKQSFYLQVLPPSKMEEQYMPKTQYFNSRKEREAEEEKQREARAAEDARYREQRKIEEEKRIAFEGAAIAREKERMEEEKLAKEKEKQDQKDREEKQKALKVEKEKLDEQINAFKQSKSKDQGASSSLMPVDSQTMKAMSPKERDEYLKRYLHYQFNAEPSQPVVQKKEYDLTTFMEDQKIKLDAVKSQGTKSHELKANSLTTKSVTIKESQNR